MISIIKSKMGIKIEEVWFSPQKNNDKNVDVIKYCQTPSEFAYLDRKSKTLISELSMTEEELLKSFNETARHKIKLSRREDIVTTIKFSDSMTKEEIEKFVEEYHKFTFERGLPDCKSERKYFLYLCKFYENNNLAVSSANVNGKAAVFHVHIHDEAIARLLLSFSHFRNDETISSSLISNANCLLHYDDMIEFKNRGIRFYDWGGISNEKEFQNITSFKKYFRGNEVETFYVKEATTFKGKLALDIEKRIRKYNE